MKNLIVFLLLCATSVSCEAADIHAELQQAKAAQRILLDWQAEMPNAQTRYLHLVCWTPADREFPEDDATRLTRIMQHIQAFYQSEMERFGFDDHTIRLQFADQKLVLHRVRGSHPTVHYGKPSGSEIRQECLPVLQQAGIDIEQETVVIMCNLATWDAKELKFTHESPYYAGGSYRRGTAWQLDSPELDTTNLSMKMPIISDGQYGQISLGKHNSIFIGGIAHELGHALGLPHCKERPDEAIRGTALMGSGNRSYGDELRNEGLGSFLTFAHALRLASHPQFSGSVKGIHEECKATIDELNLVVHGKSIEVTGVVKGTPPIYGIVAYFDPDGGGDYNATTATAVPDRDGHFTLSSDALKSGVAGELRLFPLHVNGSAAGQMSATNFRYPYQVAKDGTPDLSTYQVKKELAPIIEAVNSRNVEGAKALAAKLQLKQASEIAKSLLNETSPSQSPAEYDGELKSINLTDLKPESAKVGWKKPAFNRLPNESLLLESGGILFKSGIYAHAPANHTYQLGGKWSMLNGTVGIAAGSNGSVEFEIIGDGKSLWKSDVIESQLQTFNIDLRNIQTLGLVTHPTPDGPGSDWGLWLEPIINR